MFWFNSSKSKGGEEDENEQPLNGRPQGNGADSTNSESRKGGGDSASAPSSAPKKESPQDFHESNLSHQGSTMPLSTSSFMEQDESIQSLRSLVHTTYSIAQRLQQESDEQKVQNSMFQLHRDTYSFLLIYNVCTLMFTTAFFVHCLQMTLYGLALASATEFGTGSRNPLGIPVNVEPSVTAAQFLALGIAILVQDTLWESLFILGNFQIMLKDVPGISRLRLLACVSMKLSESILSLVLILVLICQTEEVIDLLMDFAALLFVSSLDNIVFMVGKDGYFGSRFKKATAEVEDIRFFTSGRKRRKLILRITVISSIYVALLVSWIIICPVRQNNGYYQSDMAIVQFPGGSSDNALSFFTGVYKLDKSRIHDRRLVYVEENRASSTDHKDDNGRSLQTGITRFPAYFAYCKRVKAWVFVAGSKNDNTSPCSSYKAVSSKYRGYDLLASSSEAWYLNDAKKEPIENFFLQELLSIDDNPERFGLKEEFDLPCPELQLDELKGPLVGTRQFSSQYSLLYDDSGRIVEVHTRPVYVNTAAMDIILFTGSEWILTAAAFLYDYNTASGSLAFYLLKAIAEGL